MICAHTWRVIGTTFTPKNEIEHKQCASCGTVRIKRIGPCPMTDPDTKPAPSEEDETDMECRNAL